MVSVSFASGRVICRRSNPSRSNSQPVSAAGVAVAGGGGVAVGTGAEVGLGDGSGVGAKMASVGVGGQTAVGVGMGTANWQAINPAAPHAKTHPPKRLLIGRLGRLSHFLANGQRFPMHQHVERV